VESLGFDADAVVTDRLLTSAIRTLPIMTSGPAVRASRSPMAEGDSLDFGKGRKHPPRHASHQRILLSSLDLHTSGIVGEMELARPGLMHTISDRLPVIGRPSRSLEWQTGAPPGMMRLSDCCRLPANVSQPADLNTRAEAQRFSLHRSFFVLLMDLGMPLLRRR
jgi:hypothetical protein